VTLGVEPGGDFCSAADGRCITCGDEGIPMRVAEVDGELAVCRDENEERHEVAVDLVGPVTTGDRVLVHAGVAIGRLDAVGAAR
jgi:hydrogenase assembly chaperone HypC/HupF